MEKLQLGLNGYNACNIYTEGGDGVATVYGLPLHTKVDEVDPVRYREGLEWARFIITACNNHALLLAALKEIADDGIEKSRDPRTLIANRAIATAEGLP